MAPRSETDRTLLTRAVMRAVMDARWHSEDLISRNDAAAVPGLLRAQATELASSGLARDQLLALVLLEAAGKVERHGAASELDTTTVMTRLNAEASERMGVRSEAFETGPLPPGRSWEVVAAIEARLQRDDRPRPQLAEKLRGEARLHELLWDHPRLPGSPSTRLEMLLSAPKLLERAADLSVTPRRHPVAPQDPAATAERSVRLHRTPWFQRPLLGLLPQGWLIAAGAALAAAATGLLAEG